MALVEDGANQSGLELREYFSLPDILSHLQVVAFCHLNVCKMYENIYRRIRPDGDNKVLPLCHPMIYFNATLCMEEYRDVKMYCNCFYRGRVFWNELLGDGSKEKISAFNDLRFSQCGKQTQEWLLIGKRFMDVPDMRALLHVDGCEQPLCRWIYELADPVRRRDFQNAANALYEPPESCHNEVSDLPIHREQCRAMLQSSNPYDVCPWTKLLPMREGRTDEMLCFNTEYVQKGSRGRGGFLLLIVV